MDLGREQWEAPVLAGSAALLVALAEILLFPHDGAWGGVWPGIALLVGLLLRWGDNRVRIAALAGGAALGLAVAAGVHRVGVAAGLLHGIGTLGAALLAFRRLGGEGRARDLMARTGGLRAFAGAAAVAALVPACLETARSGWRQGLADYPAVLLFLLLATPAVLLIARDVAWGRDRTDADRFRSAAVLAACGGAAVLAFAAGALPLPFLAVVAVLVAAWRLGAPGGAVVAAVVALVAVRAGDMGAGPIALAPAAPTTRFVVQQLFLACCFGAGLPFALLVQARAGEAGQAHALARRLCTVVENSGDVLFLLDAQGRWTYLNPAWAALSGVPPEQSLGRSWLDWVDAEDRDTLDRQAVALLAGEAAPVRHTLRFRAPGGLRWVELFLQPVADANGRPAGAAGSLRDVDERKRLEEHTLTARRAAEQRAREATLLASTDELTGIPNRRAFLHQLDREIEAAIDYGWPLAVALFDVDHFKSVNDRFGHAVGDRVLQHIAARAVASVRGGDLVGRLGGEEFGILMPGSSAAEAAIVAERLRRAVQAPAVDGQALPSVTVSIGIAQREDQRAAETLLATADRALYRAKDEGRNRIRIAA